MTRIPHDDDQRQRAALKERYLACDFATDNDERWLLEEAMLRALTIAQRAVWRARFCGLTRRDGHDVAGPRLCGEVAAAEIGGGREAVRQQCRRAAPKLLRWLAEHEG